MIGALSKEKGERDEKGRVGECGGFETGLCVLTSCLLPELHDRKSGVYSGPLAEAQI